MIDVRRGSGCEGDGCGKRASFGCKRQRKARFCASHREDGMVNVSATVSVGGKRENGYGIQGIVCCVLIAQARRLKFCFSCLVLRSNGIASSWYTSKFSTPYAGMEKRLRTYNQPGIYSSSSTIRGPLFRARSILGSSSVLDLTSYGIES